MIDPKNPDFSYSPVSPKRPSFGYKPAISNAIPSVTIITPFYNTGEIFHDTARSVLKQSFQQWEWLIINDGSDKQDALSILDKYRDIDHRVKVIDYETNKGLSAARNAGFRLSSCKYVVQLDSDDLLEPTAVEKWFWFLESYPEYAFCKGYSLGFGAQEYLWEKGFHNGRDFLFNNLVDPTSMIRKEVHAAVNGYDESMREGLEDWDFWLRCASFGYWGNNIPEYLDWYRRRPTHGDRWSNWDNGRRQRAFRKMLRDKYKELWGGKFPDIKPRWQPPNKHLNDELPCENRLQKEKPRILMIVPWLSMGGADKFTLDLVHQLTKRGWEITIATTLPGDHSWLPYFGKFTPDIFILNNFLRIEDYPRFLRYLIQSRQVNAVIVSHSELGYKLLPYVRSYFPNIALLDICHIEEEYWNKGGYPTMSIQHQESLDLNIVVSEHLKTWMITRGANPNHVDVCYINIDTEEWRPDPGIRPEVRKDLGIDESTPLILYAGRICPQKQPRVFAKTIDRLSDEGVDFVAVVAGDGENLRWLKRFVEKNKLKIHVRFLGAVSSQRVRELMTSADIFFLPSAWEGIALAIYEAMSTGLPVVGADVGGQRELLTPECGILIEPSDEDTEASRYAKTLLELIQNPQRRTEMGREGRERVCRNFQLDHMGERMVHLVQKAMHLNKTQPRTNYGLEVARSCASQAIESARISLIANNLWVELPSLNLRLKTFFLIKKLSEPFLQWGMDRGWTWLSPLSERIKRIFLPKI